MSQNFKKIEMVSVLLIFFISLSFASISTSEDKSGPQYEGTDDLTESNALYWNVSSADYSTVDNQISLDSVNFKNGVNSVKLATSSGSTVSLSFPCTRNADMDLSNQDSLHFWINSQNQNSFQGHQPEIHLGTLDQGEFIYIPTADLLTPNMENWVEVTVPLNGDSHWIRKIKGTPLLTDIDYIEFRMDAMDTGFTCWLDGLYFSPGLPEFSLPSLDAPDIDILYIARTPSYERYDVLYDENGLPLVVNPQHQNWPDPGELTTWTIYLANKGKTDADSFDLNWFYNGQFEASVNIEKLDSGEEKEIYFNWNFPEGTNEFTVVADAENSIPELTAANNQMTVKTTDLTCGFYIEEGAYNRLNEISNQAGSFSCEDWLQRATADTMNTMFRQAVYDFAPNGIKQSLRIDKVIVVPDGSLLDTGTHVPVDLEVDGVWGIRTADIDEYLNYNTLKNSKLIYELSRQLGLIDLSRMNIEAENNQVNGLAYTWSDGGIMNGGKLAAGLTDTDYADCDVYGLNSTQGYRRGYNGEYLYTLPDTCQLKILSKEGLPLYNARLELYQRDISGLLDASADIIGKVNFQGIYSLPNHAVEGTTTMTGHTLKPNPFGQIDLEGRNGVFLVKVNYYNVLDYIPLYITDFNLAKARGSSVVTLQTQIPFELDTSKPDLYPTNIIPDNESFMEGTVITFNSGVTNGGDAAVESFSVQWYVDGIPVGAPGLHSAINPTETVEDDPAGIFQWTAVAGVHTISFQVDADNGIDEYDENNNFIELNIEVTPLFKPDLIPADIIYDPAALIPGRLVIFDSGIINQGNADAGSFNVKWLVDGADTGIGGEHDGINAQSTVLDGNSIFEWAVEAGEHTITFIIDSSNLIVESDENNNRISINVNVKPIGKPDLKPAQIIYDKSLNFPGSIIRFCPSISNIGNADADQFRVKWQIDDKDVGTASVYDPIPAYTTLYTGQCSFLWTALEGKHTITMLVDSEDTIQESNEKNNSITIILNIISKELPDLKPTAITYDPDNLIVGNTIVFDSGVANIGKKTSNEFLVKWLVDGHDAGVSGNHEGIPADTTVMDGYSSFSWEVQPGSHMITFIIDADNQILEDNENNNSRSIMVQIK